MFCCVPFLTFCSRLTVSRCPAATCPRKGKTRHHYRPGLSAVLINLSSRLIQQFLVLFPLLQEGVHSLCVLSTFFSYSLCLYNSLQNSLYSTFFFVIIFFLLQVACPCLVSSSVVKKIYALSVSRHIPNKKEFLLVVAHAMWCIFRTNINVFFLIVALFTIKFFF